MYQLLTQLLIFTKEFLICTLGMPMVNCIHVCCSYRYLLENQERSMNSFHHLDRMELLYSWDRMELYSSQMLISATHGFTMQHVSVFLQNCWFECLSMTCIGLWQHRHVVLLPTDVSMKSVMLCGVVFVDRDLRKKMATTTMINAQVMEQTDWLNA